MIGLLQWLVFGLVRLLTGAQANWVGCAPVKRQRIYFANHSSHLDTILITAALPPELRAVTHPVAARDYWGSSAVRRFLAMRCLNAVLIDRSGGSDDPLQPLMPPLEKGESLIIFPEGTRGSGEIGAFRSGLFNLATRFPDTELVPVYLANLHRVLPKGSMLLVPLLCTARFGAPLQVGEGEARADFLTRARDALVALSGQRPTLSTAPEAASNV
jgi:1-acyl-sn-glycerol-3-phosphate acyltransferase